MKRTIIMVLTAAGALWSCTQNETITVSQNGDVRASMSTMAIVGSNSGAGTRGIVDGTYYFQYTQFSAWVESNPTGASFLATPFTSPYVTSFYRKLGYDNISVVSNSGLYNGTNSYGDENSGWYFTPKGGTSRFNRLGLFESRGDLIMYCFYPYQSTLAPIGGPGNDTPVPVIFPFDIKNGNDYMYTGPIYLNIKNASTPSSATAAHITNPNILDKAGNMMIDVNWHHAMTSIDFQIRAMLPGTLVLDSIVFDVLDALNDTVHNALATKGTIDARTGVITSTDFTGHYNKSYNATIIKPGDTNYGSVVGNPSWAKGSYTSCALILPAISYIPGGKIVATFYWKYNNKKADGTMEQDSVLYNINGSKIEIPFDNPYVSAGTGFATGGQHIVRIQVDNFIKYEGFPVPEEWKDDTATLPNIKF